MTDKTVTFTMDELNEIPQDQMVAKFKGAGFTMTEVLDDRGEFNHVFLHARKTGVSKGVTVDVTTDYGKHEITFTERLPGALIRPGDERFKTSH